jgi:hypothetical protein
VYKKTEVLSSSCQILPQNRPFFKVPVPIANAAFFRSFFPLPHVIIRVAAGGKTDGKLPDLAFCPDVTNRVTNDTDGFFTVFIPRCMVDSLPEETMRGG